jgi:hypothetical protein
MHDGGLGGLGNGLIVILVAAGNNRRGLGIPRMITRNTLARRSDLLGRRRRIRAPGGRRGLSHERRGGDLRRRSEWSKSNPIGPSGRECQDCLSATGNSGAGHAGRLNFGGWHRVEGRLKRNRIVPCYL